MVETLPIDTIEADPDNVRKVAASPEADELLVASIRAHGVLQPIMVRDISENGPPKFRVVFGNRRLALAIKAGLEYIPAEITNETNLGKIRMMQIAENNARADMTLLDLWSGVEKAAADLLASGYLEGSINATIGAAMNLSQRRVRLFRALGTIHPDIQAHIRSKGVLPDDRYLHIICQADQATQGKAWKAANNRSNPTNLWQDVADACRVRRVSMALARFDRHLYTGPVSEDLLSEVDGDSFAEDVPQFVKLQRQWAAEEAAKRRAGGWGDAALVDPEDDLRDPPTPPDCYRFDGVSPDKAPAKKSERASWVYRVTVHPDGVVAEKCWPSPTLARQASAPAEAPAEAPEGVEPQDAASVPPAAGPVTPPGKPIDIREEAFSRKGIERLGEIKREAVAAGLAECGDEDDYETSDAHDLILVLAVLLREFTPHGPDASALFDGGRLAVRGRRNDVLSYAYRLAAEVALRDGISLPTIELLGDWMNQGVAYPTAEDDLALAKKPFLLAAADQLGLPNDVRKTLPALRAAIQAKTASLVGTHPALGWIVPGAPPPQPAFASIAEEAAEPAPDADQAA